MNNVKCGGKMLLKLPKDVLSYILSLVIYETFEKNYAAMLSSIETNLHRLTHDFEFYCEYNNGCMSGTIKQLSRVHPVFRQILIRATVFSNRDRNFPDFQFKRSFFNSLLPEKK